MFKKIKENFGAVIFGAVIVATAWLGYVFYKNISLLGQTTARLNALMTWACSKDPASCVGADGKPLQVTPAPTTETTPAPGRDGQPNTQ